MRRLELEILFWASRAALIFLLSPHISDIGLYHDYGRNLIEGGRWPYLDFPFEYPPLAYPFALLPAAAVKLLGLSGGEAFRVFFGFMLLPFDYWLFRSFAKVPPFRGAAFAYVLLTLAMGLLAYDRFDLAVGFLLAFPFLKKQPPSDRRLGVSLGLGGALKLVPLSLAPVPLLFWREWGSGATWRRFAVFFLLVAGPVAACCALAFYLGNGHISFLSHHTGRGVQVESLVGSIVIALQTFFGAAQAGIKTNFGGQHLGESAGAVGASRALFYGSLLFSYFFLWWERRRHDALTGSWLVISGFVTFGYVLSPQFLLWLIPLGLLAAGRVPAGWKRGIWLGVFGLVVALTGVHFRWYWDYINMHYLSVAGLLGRNLLLAGLWGLSWFWLRRAPA